MPKNDLVDAQWARDAREAVDAAVEEWNRQNPDSDKLTIVWGHPDSDSADSEKLRPPEDQSQFGLLSHPDYGDFELWCFQISELLPPLFNLELKFKIPEWLPLPEESAGTAVILQECLMGAVQPMICPPDPDGDDEDDHGHIAGFRASFFSTGLSGHVLDYYIWSTNQAAEDILKHYEEESDETEE